ncbi:hypothetical protein AVEN_6037-1 [Araneus ventricosus]|uniref:Uncharacterized protein n=1 Tax=Araneus ventricosus TaxID=182803 RepID=A0A4Y2VAP4_ARAVE|nr:hypothetical protein AVEN_6037-1 [Araneus ventricosus]
MMRKTSGLSTLSPNFRTSPVRGYLTHVRFNLHQAHKHSGFSVESGIEPVGRRSRSQDLTTKPEKMCRIRVLKSTETPDSRVGQGRVILYQFDTLYQVHLNDTSQEYQVLGISSRTRMITISKFTVG